MPASREREMIEIKTGMHIMDHGKDIREILKASTKTLISLDIMCVSVFSCSLILLKFNKENVGIF